ncbi:MAG: metal-dependent hydrolase [Acidobacteriota bacterium]|nr:metal-dependent hydrolase [Acidobacteriota bacterium]MDQ5836932.1 metal-dependent hydrolase [Acidobacteriota bacterium]
MASAFTHAFFAAALGKVYASESRPARFWLLSMLCAVLPDADVIGFALGVHYDDMFGHRGVTHSLVFALLLACLTVVLFFRDAPDRRALAVYFFLVTASHGVLDALTNGGLGVAFFAPFSGERYFFPFRPVEVSPIGLSSFFSEWGAAVIESELLWVWLPASLAVAFVLIFRRLRGAGRRAAR